MANANVAEMRTTLEDCIEFCRERSDLDYCQRNLPRLTKALDELHSSYETTNRYYTDWRAEVRQSLKAWKQLAKSFRETQKRLEQIDAIGYPDQQQMYWDHERMEAATVEMVDFLDEHSDDISFAADQSEKLERELELAKDQDDVSEDTRKEYARRVKVRRDALNNAKHTISEMRDLLRSELGRESEEYQSIHWPYAINPDESVL